MSGIQSVRRADVRSGLAFKNSLRVACAFVLMIVVAGVVLVLAVTNTLEGELRAQTEEEIVLLEQIYRSEGQSGLVNAIRNLTEHALPIGHASGVFDSGGIRLAGTLPSVPPAIGWQKVQVSYSEAAATTQGFYLKRVSLDDLTLVIGRSSRIIDAARWWLLFWLIFLGTAITAGTLLLGYFASRKSLQKLRAMESVMQNISRGDISARLAVSSDHDQIDRISAEVNWHLDRLARLMEGMQSTASSIAHDIKTPLSNTQICLNQALEKIDKHRAPREDIEAALGEVQRLNAIIETVLRISRIEASAGTSSYQDFDLPTLIRDMIDFMEPLAELADQNIRLSAKSDAQLLMHADPGMIKQLLVNLLGNAIEHCPPGTSIVVECHQENPEIVLCVVDNGLGVPEADRDRILKPFERLDSARTKPGSGLGLAMVAAVAEHHGASVTLQDAAPGLRIILRFPSRAQVEAKAAQ
jgi:signal transduction histidine kinase